MDDEPGLLSMVLQTIAHFHGNILTIHQSIPINGVATLTLSVTSFREKAMQRLWWRILSRETVYII